MAGIINKPVVESIYVDAEGKTHTKYYSKDELIKSANEMQIIMKSNVPCRRQGYLNGTTWSVEEKNEDINFDEFALTAIVDFGTFQCRYLLHKYETGEWFVKQPKATRLGVIIKVERKSLDELEEERIEHNFDRHKFLEDVATKKEQKIISKRIMPSSGEIDEMLD